MNGKAWLGILVMVGGLAACASEEAAAGACESSPFVGRYVWNVGNCESGSVTAVSADSCEVTWCGGNARQAGECAGDKLFDATVSGTVFNSSENLEPMELTRDIDCSNVSVSAETCAFWQCAIAAHPDVYVQRFPERAAAEQYFADGLAVLMDKPWPARDACAIDVDLEAKLGSLATECP